MNIPYPNPLWSRLLSLLLALAVSALIFMNSNAIAASVGSIRAATLAAALWGVAAGFVHGVGFVPRLAPWRLLFHPVTGWLLMVAGAGLLLEISQSGV